MQQVKTLIITNGDSAVALLRAAGYQANILPWRDVLHDGPVPRTTGSHADDLEQLSAIRATYLADGFGKQRNELDQSFIERDQRLRAHSTYDEVTLWSEHDLYDQLQLLQILSFFHGEERTGSLQLVQANDYLGCQTGESIRRFEAVKAEVSSEQLSLADALFQAFRQSTPKQLAGFLTQDPSALPYIASALRRQFEELPSATDGLSRSQRQALQLIQHESLLPKHLFGRTQAYEDAVFMGELSFWRCLEELAFNRFPLVQGLPFRFVDAADKDQQMRYLNAALTLTEIGESVLAGKADHVEFNLIDRWLGGTHIAGDEIWRWDRDREELVSPHSECRG